MDCQAIIGREKGGVTLETVTLPEPKESEIVVDCLYSGISMGTERNLLTGNVDWGPFPISPGYQAVGEVIQSGSTVERFDVGDTVCYRDNVSVKGEDRHMMLNENSTKTEVTIAMGTHSSRALIDPVECYDIGKVPPSIDLKVASQFVLPGIALNGVEMAEVRYDDTVIVIGVGLVGLGVVAAANERGADIIAIDLSDERLDVATKIGADKTVNANKTDVMKKVESIIPGGADIVFEATGNSSVINTGLKLCEPHGTFVFQADYGETDISFAFREAHTRNLTAYFPCNGVDASCRSSILNQIASGTLPWRETITDVISPNEAPSVYDQVIDESTDGQIGVVIDWQEAPQ